MKKRNAFLLAAVALLAFAACIDKDLYDPEHANEVRQAQYEKAFRQAFGEIDPNHDWGFGTSATKALTTRALDNIDVPAAPDAPEDTDFKENASGIPYATNTYYNDGISYYIDSKTTSIQLNKKVWNDPAGGSVYVTENVTPSDKFYIEGGNIYLCKGATLNLTAEQFYDLRENTKVYIEEDATLSITGPLPNNKSIPCKIYNKGNISIEDLQVSANGLVYNCGNGKLTATGMIRLANGTAKIVNDGTMTCSSLEVADDGASLWNIGSCDVNGTTTLNGNNVTLVNNGNFKTSDLNYTAGSSNIYNCCKMEITNTLNINLGDSGASTFYVDGSIVAKRVEMIGPSRITMTANSVMKVTDELVVDCTKYGYGIVGPTEGYAVVTSPKISKGKDNQGYEVTYGGNLYIATDRHFAQGYSGQYPYYDLKGNAQIIEGKDAAPIYIAPTECNPGYGTKVVATTSYTVKYMEQGTNKELSPAQKVSNKNAGDVITETAITIPNYTCVSASPTDATITLVEDVTQNVIIFYYKKNTTTSDTDSVETARYRVFAEDLGSIGDFDFNDVVFDVIQYTKNSQEYTDVVIQAAGGTLPLVLDIPGLTEKIEVHSKFGVNTNVMVNTGSGPTVEKEKLPRYTVTGTVEPADIDIWVTYSSQEQPEKIIAPIGEAPGKFCVPNTTQPWASERVSIAKDFEGFKKWVGDSNYTWWNQLVIP